MDILSRESKQFCWYTAVLEGRLVQSMDEEALATRTFKSF